MSSLPFSRLEKSLSKMYHDLEKQIYARWPRILDLWRHQREPALDQYRIQGKQLLASHVDNPNPFDWQIVFPQAFQNKMVLRLAKGEVFCKLKGKIVAELRRLYGESLCQAELRNKEASNLI